MNLALIQSPAEELHLCYAKHMAVKKSLVASKKFADCQQTKLGWQPWK